MRAAHAPPRISLSAIKRLAPGVRVRAHGCGAHGGSVAAVARLIGIVASLTVTLHNDRRELVRLAGLVERFASEQRLPDESLAKINLVLDEMVSNVIKYGRVRDGEGGIDVVLALEGGLLTIDLADDGVAFNPLEATPPDLDRPIVERPIGGLGIHIVKALSETIAYRRENDRNRLTMTMRVQDSRQGSGIRDQDQRLGIRD